MAPKDENELRNMIYSAFTYDNPVAVRYPRSVGFGVPIDKEPQILPKGKAELLEEGEDITLIGFGPVVYLCLETAKKLQQKGIKAGVINLRFINPIDKDLIIRQVRQTHRVITVEDHVLAGGMGSAVLEILNDENVNDVLVGRIGYNNYVEHGPIPILYQEYGLTVDNIIALSEKLLK